MKGIYCLVAYLNKSKRIKIARLGYIPFKRGYYCYIGSAMTSLEKRVERHYSKKKKRYWHIDYFLDHAKLIGFKALEMTNREECWLADQIRKISDGEVRRFGSTDCGCSSHLQYFKKNPLKLRRFSRIFKPRLEDLLKSYASKKVAIKKRLLEFREMWKEPDERIFAELCFCICTPQSRARACSNAIERMERIGILFRGDEEDIRRYLVGVRFPRNKARYIVNARNFLTRRGNVILKGRIRFADPIRVRNWLVRNIKGVGYKEASHFLRNIGLGEKLAILDRHILKNLLKYGIIKSIPKTLTPKQYLEIEKKMRKFSKRMDIPLAELDLLLWSEETGEIFK
jgi:N-glycosylase/DNA lyase